MMDTMIVFMLDLLFLLTMRAGGVKWDLPNPRKDPSSCGRGVNPSYVCDPGHILTTEDADFLDEYIDRLTIPCLCHVEVTKCTKDKPIGIAIVKEHSSISNIDKDKDKKQPSLVRFGNYLRDVSWKLGRCADDLIIVLSTDTRQSYTSLGNSAKHTLGENCTKNIPNFAAEYFSNGYYTDGLSLMLSLYQKSLNGSSESCLKKPGPPPQRLQPVALPKRSKGGGGSSTKKEKDETEYGRVKETAQLKNGKLYAGIAIGSLFGGILFIFGLVSLYMYCIHRK